MSTTDVTQRNVAHSVLLALEAAEHHLMPRGSHSRLFVAILATQEAISYISFPTITGRTRLRLRLEDLQRVESNAVALGQLAPDSPIARGISLAILVTQTALAGVAYNAEHALREARRIHTATEAQR